MTNREWFFALLEGNDLEGVRFYPDITDWYVSHRTPPGKARAYWAGEFVPDDAELHSYPGTMPAKYADWTLLDFYRNFDWGYPVHIYDWFDVEYAGDVEKIIDQTENEMRFTLRTPKGELTRVEKLAGDGTWCPVEHYVKKLSDLEIITTVIEATSYKPKHDYISSILQGLGQLGYADLVLSRSPFGKLVHEYMGFEQVIYALVDSPEILLEVMAVQEQRDLELVHLAAEAPGKLVILSDHADENLIAPPHYKQYCIPFYQKVTAILHAAGKKVSTHLDGNFHGFFGMLGDSGFDYLDGCTPAPMFNYEVEELAEAVPDGMVSYCGVPPVLFCRKLPTQDILDFGKRIIEAFNGRCVLNVGDILPPDGDMEQVIALGELAKQY